MNRRISFSFLIFIVVLSFLDKSTIAQTDLTPYQSNPIITVGQPGSWDAGIVFLPWVIGENGTFHLFYAGCLDMMTQPLAIGYATSSDGLTFTKSPSNPIFEADGTGFDAYLVGGPVVLVEDTTWIMYYSARSAPGAGPGQAIGRATTVIDPSIPWTSDEDPVLEVGGASEWDSGFITPTSIIALDSGYVMYYSGGTGYPMQPSMVGMATSVDGIAWTKYDDPSTTDPPYAESDPVVQLGPPGSWDSGYAWQSAVLYSGIGWEMYYTGVPDNWTGEWIGYATSADGVQWTQYQGNPILGPNEPWATQDVVAGSVIMIDQTYYLYYSGLTTMVNGQIGIALSPSTGIGDDHGGFLIPKALSLGQNYPNPFNPSTNISFEIPSVAGTRIPDNAGAGIPDIIASKQRVSLAVYDVRGRRVRVLVDSKLEPGSHRVHWDGRNDRGETVPSGIYLYTLRAGNEILTRKMAVLK